MGVVFDSYQGLFWEKRFGNDISDSGRGIVKTNRNFSKFCLLISKPFPWKIQEKGGPSTPEFNKSTPQENPQKIDRINSWGGVRVGI